MSKVHHDRCKIDPNRIAKDRDGKEVGLQRNFEPEVLALCGSKVLACWLPTHWNLCFEIKGGCFHYNKIPVNERK